MAKQYFSRAIGGAARLAVRAFLHSKERPKAVRARDTPSSSRIHELRSLEPGMVVIFAAYPKMPIERGTIAFLHSLADAGAQVVAVATAPFPPTTRAALERFASTIIEIDNIGRDFGAYQRGVFFVRDKLGFARVTRLVFVNDSIYFFERADRNGLVAGLLNSAYPYVGSNENFEQHYHVGSYCFSVGTDVIASAAFQNFWHRYIPYSTRVHSINKGEVGLCRAIMSAGFTPHILYPLYEVMPPLMEHLKTLRSDDYLICLELRRGILSDFDRAAQTRSPIPATITSEQIRSFYQERNQIHCLGLPFVKYLGAPFIKKDIVLHGVHLISDVVNLVSDEAIDEAEAVLVPFRHRGSPSSRRGLKTRLRTYLRLA